MGQRFARACTLSLSFLSQICFCGSRTALPLPQTGRGYKEREGHRERKRESALKKRGKRERVKLKRASLGFVRSSGTKSTVRRKQKKTDSLKFEFTSNRKASAEQAPPPRINFSFSLTRSSSHSRCRQRIHRRGNRGNGRSRKKTKSSFPMPPFHRSGRGGGGARGGLSAAARGGKRKGLSQLSTDGER